MQNWFVVGRFELDGTVPVDEVVAELERAGDVIDVDDQGGYVMSTPDASFISTSKNMNELRGDARRALPRPKGCKVPEVINVTRVVDNYVFEFYGDRIVGVP